MKKHGGEKSNLSATNFENTFEDTHWRKADHQSLNASNNRYPSSLSYLVSGRAVALLVISFYAQENHTQL